MATRHAQLWALLLVTAIPTAESGNAALILVDVQNCFVDGGSLAVAGGASIVEHINRIRAEKGCLFHTVARSRDYHPAGHISFASTHGIAFTDSFGVGTPVDMTCLKPANGDIDEAACFLKKDADGNPVCAGVGCTCDNNPSCTAANPAVAACAANPGNCYDMKQSMWPDHCLQDGDSQFLSNLTTANGDIVVRKGHLPFVDAYSVFMDNTQTLHTGLGDMLKARGVDTVYIAGIATDFCVYWTARDAVNLGFTVNVIEDASMGIGIPTTGDATTITEAVADMRAMGITMLNTADVLATECPAAPPPPKRALVVVDVQDCFVDGGTLAVAGAQDVVPNINQIRAEKECLFDAVYRSRDYHPPKHISFASTHGITIGDAFPVGTPLSLTCLRPDSGNIDDAACCLAKDTDGNLLCANHNCTCTDNPTCAAENNACTTCADDPSKCFAMQQSMWPDHCLQEGDSTFVSGLTTKDRDIVVRKGHMPFVDAYSVFMDNTKTLQTAIHASLKEKGITEVYIVGIATDFCVYWSAQDAARLGYKVFVVEDASKGIGIPTGGGATTISEAREDMLRRGVHLVQTADVLSMGCAETGSPTGVTDSPTQPAGDTDGDGDGDMIGINGTTSGAPAARAGAALAAAACAVHALV